MKHPIALAFLFVALGSQAQLLKPEWSDVPWNAKNKRPNRTWGPVCEGNNAYMLGNMAEFKNELIGYLWPENERASVQPVSIPHQERHPNINGFTAFAGGPVVIYDEWDKKTGEVTVFVQPYTARFEPSTAPIRLGVLPLDPKRYNGAELEVTTELSRDGTKLLIAFDDIQANNVKLLMCWVLNSEMEHVWSGSYQLPVQSYDSGVMFHLSNEGDVVARVQGVPLTSENLKEKQDGSVKVKVVLNATHEERVQLWLRLRGETLQMWDGSVTETNDPTQKHPLWLNDQLYFLVKTNKNKNDGEHAGYDPEFMLFEMDDEFVPQLVARRSHGKEVKSMFYAAVLETRSNSILIATKLPTSIVVQEVDLKLNVKWEVEVPRMDKVSLLETKDAVLIGAIVDGKQMESLFSSGIWVGSKEETLEYDPVMVRIERGTEKLSAQRLAPPNPPKGMNYFYITMYTFQKCSCYVRASHDKQPPGFMRTLVDQ